MTRKLIIVAAACAVLGLTTAVSIASGQQAQGGEGKSAWNGVYTEAQAGRGETAYAESCEHCHLGALEGNAVEEVPSLVWETFASRWSGKSVGELIEVTSRSMPKDAPGTLSRRAYIDLVAFILSKNNFPAGASELPQDVERLKQITIDKTRPADNSR